MNKAFDKILERLSNIHRVVKTDEDAEWNRAIYKSTEIVQEVAGEYNDGWIPCSERLPEDDYICIVTVEYPNNETVVQYGWFDKKRICWYVGMQEFRTSNVLAWQPLPDPYKESK